MSLPICLVPEDDTKPEWPDNRMYMWSHSVIEHLPLNYSQAVLWTHTEACNQTLVGGINAESSIPYLSQWGQMTNSFVAVSNKIGRQMRNDLVTTSHKTAVFHGRIAGHSARTQMTVVKTWLHDLCGEKQCDQGSMSKSFVYNLYINMQALESDTPAINDWWIQNSKWYH